MTKEFSIMRPTNEAVKTYNSLLTAKHKAKTLEKICSIHEELMDLKHKWDWSNILFKDEKTGKLGVKDVSGKMLVAAKYDEFGYLGTYAPEPSTAIIAVRDGSKWGFIFADGTGQFACDTIFDHLEWIPSTNLYAAKWSDKTDTIGIVNAYGLVVFPNTLSKVGEVTHGIVRIEKDGKVGAVGTHSDGLVMPEYDSWTITDRWNILFKKGQTEGYVSTSTGLFIPKSEFDRRDYIGMDDFLMVDND